MESRPYDWKVARTVIAYFSHAFLAPRLDPHERAPAWGVLCSLQRKLLCLAEQLASMNQD